MGIAEDFELDYKELVQIITNTCLPEAVEGLGTWQYTAGNSGVYRAQQGEKRATATKGQREDEAKEELGTGTLTRQNPRQTSNSPRSPT